MKRTIVWGILLIAIAAPAIYAVKLFQIPPRLPAVPAELTTRTVVPGIPGARYFGPEYDQVLRTVYTAIKQQDVARPRNFLAAVNNDGMADNRLLWDLRTCCADGD